MNDTETKVSLIKNSFVNNMLMFVGTLCQHGPKFKKVSLPLTVCRNTLEWIHTKLSQNTYNHE